MTRGPRRLVLDRYLDSAAPAAVSNAGRDWKEKADDLQELGEVLKQAAVQAELRIGEHTLTGPALRAGMEESSVAMLAKSEQLRAAGEALRQVGQQIADTRDARDALADLGPKPTPYQAPAATPGVEPTPEEIQAQADASQARQAERSAWQTEYDRQEARSLALTKEMDAAFLAAIPPMKEIHGQQDPTEPPPRVPSGPAGPYLPGTPAPLVTGGGGGGGAGQYSGVRLAGAGPVDPSRGDQDGVGDRDDHTSGLPPTTVVTTHPTHIETPTAHLTPSGAEDRTATVVGTAQHGVAYQPTTAQGAAPGGVGGSSAGVSAAALGAAGGAGGLAAGASRPGSPITGTSRGAAPVRAIGSTGRAGSAGALSRSVGSAAGTTSSSVGRSVGSTGGSTSRSAGSAAVRGASTGTGTGVGGAGARGAGAGSGVGRGARRGRREQTPDRDSLVHDQDWLGDDDVAPGVLD